VAAASGPAGKRSGGLQRRLGERRARAGRAGERRVRAGGTASGSQCAGASKPRSGVSRLISPNRMVKGDKARGIIVFSSRCFFFFLFFLPFNSSNSNGVTK
jgi:hypothetical protein